MRFVKYSFVLIALLALVSCSDVLSTEPLAARDDTSFDTSLLGTWFDPDDTVISVTSGQRPFYDITVVDRQKQNRFVLQGRLVEFGDQRVLDLTDMQPALYSVPGHAWLVVTKRGDGLEVQHLDTEWLQAQVRRSGLSHTLIGGRLLITAPAERLRSFVARYGLRPEARGEPLYLTPFPQHHTN